MKSARSIFIASILLISMFLCGAQGFAADAPEAKYIILFIGDGMQLQHEMAASRFLFGTDTGLSFHSFPYQNAMTTWNVTTYNAYAAKAGKANYDPETFDPLVGYDPAQGGEQPWPLAQGNDSYFLWNETTGKTTPDGKPTMSGPATDSAAAATVMATGIKTETGNLSWLAGDPDDGQIETIAEKERRIKGRAIGVVSTVPFSHATPAGFVSHNVNRNNFYTGILGYTGLGIADEIITKTKPEVVIGSGHPRWNNPDWSFTGGHISKKMYKRLKNSEDFVFVEREPDKDGAAALSEAADRAVAAGKMLFGLFGGGGAGNFEPPVPVQGQARVERATTENPLLADLVLSAVKVLGSDPDGFFLLAEQGDLDWANHKNDYQWMVGTVWDLHNAVQALVDYVNQPGDDMDWSNTLVMVTADHANSYLRLKDTDKLVAGYLPEQICVDGSTVCGYPGGEVTYSTGGHTNEPVMLYAMGDAAVLFEQYEGQWYPGTRLVDNTHLYRVMAEAAGIEVSTPEPHTAK